MRDPNERPSTADLAYGRTNETDERGPDAEEKAGLTTEGRAGRPDMKGMNGDSQTPLLTPERSTEYSSRWQDVQAEFVDEPQKAVEDADGLVAEVIQTLATSFADQRRSLEEQWSRGSEVSTEDLRQALMQYRSFFQRLLAA